MNILKTEAKFGTKLTLAIGTVLIALVLMSSMFALSLKRYNDDDKRIELAYSVLIGILSVSNHTYSKLNAMGETVSGGKVVDPDKRFENETALRDAVKRARELIAAELAMVGDEELSELDRLEKIEALVERIIRGSTLIRYNVQNGQTETARAELGRLRSEEVTGRFNRLINEAIADERLDVSAAEKDARELSHLINDVLPTVLVIVVGISLFMIFTITRGLTQSVTTLRNAAKIFSQGEFDYRIAPLEETEFDQLGSAFNQMAEKLQTADRSRRRFIADISHELRTPLTIIQGEAEVALRGEPKTITEYIDTLTRVREQALHTTRLVEDLLFVARSEAGHSRIEKRSVAVARIVIGVCMDLENQAAIKSISIVQHITDKDAVIFGDKGRLRQVFTILLDNAIRYSAAGATINLTVSRWERFVQISIDDFGIGLTAEESERAFMRFYRGDNAAKQGPGTGLGLPVAKAIIEAHNGTIELLNRPGEGATARVRLPVEQSFRAVS